MVEKAVIAKLNGRDITVMPQNNIEKALDIVWIVEHDSGDSYGIEMRLVDFIDEAHMNGDINV